MPAIGITGGVASGKSTLTRLLAELLPAPSFDADASARRLLADDDAVRREVRAAFGPGVFTASGEISRPALRGRIFAGSAERRRLEAILHPRVRSIWQGWVQEQLQNSPRAVLLVEIPLLYETQAAAFFDRTIVVGCGPDVQMRRLVGERRLPEEIAGRIIASQWALTEKIRRCDHLIWNDGAFDSLRAQAELCARLLSTSTDRPSHATQ
jgi:dephospho-CoA kinase